MNLHEIANTGGYGTGQQARDKAAEKAKRRTDIPKPLFMNELVVDHEAEALVASFGTDSEDGKSYYINSLGYIGTAAGDYSTASGDAKAFAALWNAYREGDLVWKDAPTQPTAAE